jgi:hypothetical protein
MCRLLQLLAAHWQQDFGPAMEARLLAAAPPVPVPQLGAGMAPAGQACGPSSLASSLQAIPWLPAVLPGGGGEGTDGGIPGRVGLLRPTETFAPLPRIQRLLRHHVPYAVAPAGVGANDGEAMFGQLGVVSELTPEVVLRLLLEWSLGCTAAEAGAVVATARQDRCGSGRGAGGGGEAGVGVGDSPLSDDAGRSFSSSLSIMVGLYGFLETYLRQWEADLAARAASAAGGVSMAPSPPDAGPSTLGCRDGEGGGGGGHELLDVVVSVFSQEPLIWLPDDPRVAESKAREEALVPGRFYRCDVVPYRTSSRSWKCVVTPSVSAAGVEGVGGPKDSCLLSSGADPCTCHAACVAQRAPPQNPQTHPRPPTTYRPSTRTRTNIRFRVSQQHVPPVCCLQVQRGGTHRPGGRTERPSAGKLAAEASAPAATAAPQARPHHIGQRHAV